MSEMPVANVFDVIDVDHVAKDSTVNNFLDF